MKRLLYIFIFLIINIIGLAQSPTDFNFKLPYAETGNPYSITSTSAYTNALAFPNGCKLTYNGLYWGDENPPTDYYSELTINSGVEISDVFQFTGLTPSTTYYYRQEVINCFGTFSTLVQSFTTAASGSAPIVTTTTATSITTNSASTGGNVTNDGGSTVTSRGVYFSTSPAPISGETSGSGTGIYTTELSSLSAGTLYYYRAFATNSIGTGYGAELTFTTDENTAIPSVTTTIATEITTSSVISGGNVTYDGNSSVTERGIYYSTSPNPTTGVSSGNGTGTYSINLSSLTPNTTYYYRAYAKNISGTGYGTEYSFTTLNISGLATVITTSATNITTGQAVVGGNVTADGGSTVVGRGVCYGTSPNPTTGSSSEAGIGSFNVQISYLATGTRYYYRAYAINSSGIAYGDNLEFTTLSPLTVPVLSTVAAIEITDSTAVAGGNITYDGRSQILRSGVCYSSTTSNPTTANSLSLSSAITGNYYVMLPNLAPNTTYYFRAYAINSVGTGYGSVMSFTTTVTSTTLPTVVINSMTSIGVTTATGGGAVVSDGGATVTDRGLVWNTTGNPSLLNYTGITANGTGIGSFVSSLTRLTQCVTYYVRAYATNSVGTAYSNTDIVFTTNTLSLVELQLLYYVFNKKTTAPAELPTDYRIYTYNDANYVCSILTYYNGTHAELCRYEEPLALGAQLYGYSTPCSKSYKTGYYLYRRTGYPVLIIKTTNGIVTGINECTP